MLAVMDSSIRNAMEIFIPLLNEGVPVLRPTKGEAVSTNAYRILPTFDYDPNSEQWAFPPGSVVRCEYEIHSGKRILVAKERSGYDPE